jgi:hypothetical protein
MYLMLYYNSRAQLNGPIPAKRSFEKNLGEVKYFTK